MCPIEDLGRSVVDYVAAVESLARPPTEPLRLRLSAITFTKIADGTTLIPGGGGCFTSFGTLALDGGEVAFVGSGMSQAGVYVYSGGVLSLVADKNTAMPDRVVNFGSFSGPVSIDNGNVAFAAGGRQGGGVYTNLGGSLRAVASYAITSIPGGTGTFTGLDQPFISGTNVAFNGYGSDDQSGIYIEGTGRCRR